MKEKDISVMLKKIVNLGVSTSNNLNTLAKKVVKLERKIKELKEGNERNNIQR